MKDLNSVVEFATKMKSALGGAIKTSESTLNLFVASTIAGGSLLLYGNRGSGKSSLVEALARTLGLSEEDGYRVNGTAGMSEGEVTAQYDIAGLTVGKKVVEVARFADAMSNIALFDEIDKANPYTLHSLLPVMAEGIIKLGSFTKKIQLGAFYATMNPVGPGTFSHGLPEPLADRFDARLIVEEPEGEDMADALMARHSAGAIKSTRSVIPVVGSLEDLKAAREVLWKEVTLSEEAIKTAAYFIRSTQFCSNINKSKAFLAPGAFPSVCGDCTKLKDSKGAMACHMSQGLSMRVADSALLLARGMAAINGRTEVTGKDVIDVFPACVGHRAQLTEPAKNGDMDRQIQAFVAQMHTAAHTAISISTGATKMTFTQLEEAKKQGSPLVTEALKRQEGLIKAATERIRSRIGTMGAKELVATKKRVEAKDREVIDQLLGARSTVMVTPVDGDWTDPFFTEALSTFEGESMFSPSEWRNIVNGESVRAEISDVNGALAGGVLSLRFKTAEGADLFRERLNGFTDVASHEAPYSHILIKFLEESGYMPAAPQGNPLPPEAQAFVSA